MSTTKTTKATETLTRDQIIQLQEEAGMAGDREQVAICDRALDGDRDAWIECERVVAEAAADGKPPRR